MTEPTGGISALDDPRAFLTRHREGGRELRAQGRALRQQVPLEDHARVPTLGERAEPLELLRHQEVVREAALVPLRYERMSQSPFSFLRGAAAIMAADLSTLPSSGITVQLCGDAHLANFGMFASSERSLVFDLNDFDETLPGPFEWDVKRLAASFAVAALSFGMRRKEARKAAIASARSYAGTMAALSDLSVMDAWNARLDVDSLITRLRPSTLRRATIKASQKSGRSTSETATLKLTETVEGSRRFRSEPPVLVPVPDDQREQVIGLLADLYGDYLRTIGPDRIALLTRFGFVDVAHKVVGVGSVGTRALVLLLESGDGEPLILQAKQANASVLEPYLAASAFDNHGKRVVIGQKVLQATGDPFLGWAKGSDRTPGDYYLRQLKDMKGSIDPARLDAKGLAGYAAVCGGVLARAHARSGAAAVISGYVGRGDEFSEAMGAFAIEYNRINDDDYAALLARQAA